MKQSNNLGSLLSEIGSVESLEQALILYKRVGMSASSKSLKTRVEYENDLRDLVSYLGQSGITRPMQITLAHLRVYQAELERRGFKVSTRNRKTYAIKGFFLFLCDYAVIKQDIARELIPPQVKRGEPRFLSEAEYTRLLQACSSNIRDTAIIQLFLQTGIRLSELVGSSINDVFLAEDAHARSSIRIRRGGGHAMIPINDKARNALKKWLEVREPVSDTALFLTALKKPIGKRAVQLLLEKYLTAVGIANASVQSLRHTMTVHHLARGTHIKTLADILGDRPDTLDVYVSAARKIHVKAMQENAL